MIASLPARSSTASTKTICSNRDEDEDDRCSSGSKDDLQKLIPKKKRITKG